MQENIQASFRALADPTRRSILKHLSDKEMTIGEITDQFDMTRAAVKKHLNILESGKLISVHSRGRERLNRLEPLGLKSVSEWFNYFDHFWSGHLKSLKTAIESETKSKQKPKSK